MAEPRPSDLAANWSHFIVGITYFISCYNYINWAPHIRGFIKTQSPEVLELSLRSRCWHSCSLWRCSLDSALFGRFLALQHVTLVFIELPPQVCPQVFSFLRMLVTLYSGPSASLFYLQRPYFQYSVVPGVRTFLYKFLRGEQLSQQHHQWWHTPEM